MSRRRHLSIVGFTLTARVLFSLQQWSVIAILARADDAAGLGALGLSLALVTTFNALFNLGLRQGVATDLKDLHNRATYWRLRLLTLILSVLTIPLIIGVFWDTAGLMPVAMGVLFVKSIDLLSEFSYGLMMRCDRILSISISQILRAVLGAAGFAIGYFVFGNVTPAVIGWGISWLAVLLIYDFRILAKLGELPAIRALTSSYIQDTGLKTLLLIQLPFGIAAGLGNIGLAAPRVILERIDSLEAVGIFTALWSVFAAGEAFVIAIMQAYLTALTRALDSGSPLAARRLTQNLLIASSGLAIAVFFITFTAAPYILALLYGIGYVPYADVFILLSAAWAIRYLCTTIRSVVTARRKFWVGAGLDALGSAAAVIACYFAIQISPSMTMVVTGFGVGQAVLLLALLIILGRLVPKS